MKIKWQKFAEQHGKLAIPAIVIVGIIVVIVASFFIPSVNTIFTGQNIASAINLLENNGYAVFAAGEYATIQNYLDEILEETRHTSYIWPEATNIHATLSAPVGANTWGNWVELADGSGNKFSDKITSITHLSDTKIEEYSDKNQTYMYQFAYGDSKVIVGGRRVSPIKESGEYAIDLKTMPIPIGEKFYARCMCSSGGETCTVLIRYHYHN